LLTLLLGQSFEDARKQPPVHDRTDVSCQSIERAERRQFEALTDEVFDRDVDQVSRGKWLTFDTLFVTPMVSGC
jgi:hypothetical protein